jgi:hypothetical protein
VLLVNHLVTEIVTAVFVALTDKEKKTNTKPNIGKKQ